ncbi:MAG: hypothetical protein OXU79_04505 [Gemmatimonadota bacterium]|nr:hypothetical protein [Gemmatimonadota bacterium]
MKLRITRRSISLPFALAAATVTLFASVPSSAGTFRVGGGMFFNKNEPGGGVSVDLGDNGMMLSPYMDYFGRSGSRFFGGGLNLVAKRAGGEQSRLYLGLGGGIASVNVEESSAGITGSASKTQAMADLVLGVEFDLLETVGGFIQVKWLGTFGGGRVDITGSVEGRTVTIPNEINLELRNFAVQTGVTVGFWR